MPNAFEDAISHFGAEAKAKLSIPAATGEPEGQLRAPFEGLLARIAATSISHAVR